MAIFQESFFIPDEIMKKVTTGDYKIFGGEVRNNKGQIVKLLRPVSKLEATLYYGWKYRKPLFMVGKLGMAGVKSYIKSKKKQEPDVVVKFREALMVYLNAVRKGALTMEIISDMMECLGELKMYPKFEVILSIEELDVLLNRMYEYTKKLAVDNAIELTSLEKETPLQSDSPIIDLQRYLEIQKHIFELAS
ncbi:MULTISPECIES: hypothetical protein [Bacillaceae]|uniref:Uncharacterized protein n=1 Tax=Cytobacillus oceanisediminis 2691 TaxID=1196031 RepID=A0A160MIG1_9BACI|nr:MULTISPECIES: hypothetical protein [Bacillaceae]AND42618.1 hypothetical protein A361_26865 [Cytobacillus oceanisediminis 2691]UTI43263.1 hypothetical protein NKG37_05960 [Niallia sp. RD1]